MTSFYKMDPSDWDNGTAALSLEEEAAYLRIVNAIHKHKAPVPNIDRVLAGMFRVSTRKARALVLALCAAKKIFIEDGKIWNERARSDLVQRGFTSISRAESGAKGGRVRSKHAAKLLENNNTGQAIASYREEKRREDYSVANATDGEAVDLPSEIDFSKAIFDRGVKFLINHGTAEKQARSVIGKWRQAATDAEIFAAFAEAKRAEVVEPVAWITARLKPPDAVDVKALMAQINLDGTLKNGIPTA